MMSSFSNSKKLKTMLLIDAATCFGFGVLLTTGSGFLGSLLGLPSGLLFYAGLILFPSTALMALTGWQKTPHAGRVWFIILGNVGWAIASFGILALPAITPTGLGYGFVITQAVAVCAIALIEHRLLGHPQARATA